MKKIRINTSILIVLFGFFASFYGVGQTTVTIGTGTSSSSGTDTDKPIYSSSAGSAYTHSRFSQITTESQLYAAGISGPTNIIEWGYDKTTSGVPANNANGVWTLNVYLKATTATTLTAGTKSWDAMKTGATLVYSSSNINNSNMPSTTGFWMWTLTTSFSYSGSGGIECLIEWIPLNGSSRTTNQIDWRYTSISPNQCIGTNNNASISGTSFSFYSNSRYYNTRITYDCPAVSAFTVTGGGSVCANVGAPVGINNSQIGVSYQLKRNGLNVGSSINGTGSALSFGNQTTSGVYTIVGTNGCSQEMNGSATITILSIPTGVSAGSPPAAICSGGSANLTGTAVGAVSTINYINESFDGAGLPSGWTISKSNASLFAGVAATNNAGGIANEISFSTGGVSGTSTNYNARISFGPINTTGKTSVDLAFKTWLRRFSTSSGTITASVQTSTDGTNWNASSWSKTVSDPAYIASESITLNTTNGVGSSTFYISFFVTGRLYYLSGANFDDILLSTTENLPVTYSWSGGPISSGGTSATPVVNPTAITTYTMTATSGGCSVTSDVLVNVNTVAPGTASSNQTLCVGETPIDLTLAGSVGTIQWQKSANNTLFTNISGETATTLSGASMGPLLATTYFRALVSQGGCSATSNAVMISTPTAGTSLSTDGDQATCRVKDGNWIHFYNGGRLIVSLSCADDLGDVSVTSFVEGSPLSVAPCDEPTDPPTAVMARHWVIERDATSFPISEPIFIRLPFDNSEFGSLESAALANSNASDNLTSLSDLKLSKYAGPNNVDANPDNNCTSEGGDGTTEIFSQLESGNISSYASGFSATGKYVQFSVPGFSEFWLHGSSINSPLPIELTHFNAVCENERVNISWSTASEKNSDYFVVQKSKNMQNWENVETVKAIVNASTVTSYQLFDALNTAETIYYRLKYVDQSGKVEFYSPVAVSCENKEVFIAYPNPTEGIISIAIPSIYVLEKLEIEVSNPEGKKIDVPITNQNGTLQLDLSGVATGFYFVEIRKNNSLLEYIKCVKSN